MGAPGYNSTGLRWERNYRERYPHYLTSWGEYVRMLASLER